MKHLADQLCITFWILAVLSKNLHGLDNITVDGIKDNVAWVISELRMFGLEEDKAEHRLIFISANTFLKRHLDRINVFRSLYSFHQRVHTFVHILKSGIRTFIYFKQQNDTHIIWIHEKMKTLWHHANRTHLYWAHYTTQTQLTSKSTRCAEHNPPMRKLWWRCVWLFISAIDPMSYLKGQGHSVYIPKICYQAITHYYHAGSRYIRNWCSTKGASWHLT